MTPGIDELRARLRREKDKFWGTLSLCIIASVLILLHACGAFGAVPQFTVENKCPPSFKVTNKMPAVVVPGVTTAPRFIQDGTRTFARSRDAAGFNTGSGVIYQMAPTFTSVPGAMLNGRINGCTSYG